MRKTISLLVSGLLLTLPACQKSGNDESKIVPVTASVSIDPIASNPAVFLQKSAMDTSATDDIVVVDVMLRDSLAPNFDAFTLEVMFDPGLVQVGVLWASTPLGDCTGSGSCDPVCLNNVRSSGTTAIPANTSGDLLIGVSSRPAPCQDGTSNPGPVPLLSLMFFATTVGTSQVHLVDGPGSGDCEILTGHSISLSIPCFDGNMTITAAR